MSWSASSARAGCGGRQLEDSGHLALLGAVAHQRGVAARAERQREGIEQDRLAGAGLAGQHGEAAREIDIEPIDQDDVADREAGEHASCPTSCRTRTGHPRLTLIIKDAKGRHKAGHDDVSKSWGAA